MKDFLDKWGALVAIMTGVGSVIVFFKESIKEYLLSKKEEKKSKAKINEETVIADDNSFNILRKTVNELNDTVLEMQKKQREENLSLIQLEKEFTTYRINTEVLIENLVNDKKKHQQALIEILKSCEELCTEEKSKECKGIIQNILEKLKIDLDEICNQ